MPTIRVDVTRAMAVARHSPRAVRRATNSWLREGSALVAATMRGIMARSIGRTRVAPSNTGQSAASVRARILDAAGTAFIGPEDRPTRYGVFRMIYLDKGTRPHDIHARFAKVLAFARSGSRSGTRGGRPVSVFRFGGKASVSDLVYARSVRHPGTRGMRFVDATMHAVTDRVHRLYQQKLDQELRRQA